MLPRIFIPICDDNLWLLRPLSYLFDKYWSKDTKVVIMGFNKPDFDLSKKFEFVSLAKSQEGGASKWSRYIHDYLVTVPDEHIIFSLEDFFPIEEPRYNILNSLVKIIKSNETIGRIDITWDCYVNNDFNVIKNGDFCDLIEYKKNTMYRISTQPAIWKKSYLLKFLNNDWSPWNFEVDGSIASFSMEEKVLAIADKNFVNFPTKWIHKGAYSRFHKDKINVLGLKPDTIKEMVELGFFKEEQLQWGQWDGPVPTFYELGGYDFQPKKMPIHPASPTNWREYEPIYNNKLKVNLFDTNFSNSVNVHGFDSCSDGREAKDIEWIRNQFSFDGFTLFSDNQIFSDTVDLISCNKKIAWLFEPKSIFSNTYENIVNLEHKFDYILTYDNELLKRSNKYVKYVVGSSRIKNKNIKVHKKTKLLSLIASKKRIAEGHRFRHEIVTKFSSKYPIECWGSEYKKFDNKEDALKDYMFSICVMNSKMDNFFTEVLIDAFCVGTIPIFWGADNIGEFFDTRGMLIFNSLEELEEILKNISPELYNSKLEYINNNFQTALNYLSTDDNIAKILKGIK